MDRRRRIGLLATVLVVLFVVLGLQAVTADPVVTSVWTNGTYAGSTLISVQSYGGFAPDNGEALIVDENGSVVWEYDPPNTRVFDSEMLENGNVQVAMATRLPAEDCPQRYAAGHCIHNRVVEVDFETKDIVWNYTWVDAFMEYHEVHDADRLPSGAVAIADMGNDRAFIVNRAGEITWSWQAANHIAEGTAFWDEYVPEDSQAAFRREGPESDWTHMNDVDVLANGNLQLSIRNFDVVLEVDRETKDIVEVFGRPGRHRLMNEQHNPARLANGTLVVSDSENDRIVELDTDTGEPIWSFTGSGDTELAWPRDADRLPNGNTLITDSRHFRILEINTTGSVVWQYSLADERGIVYEADRLGIREEPAHVPSATSFGTNRSVRTGKDLTTTIESFAGLVFPPWVGIAELLTMLAITFVGLAFLLDGTHYVWSSRRR